MPGPNARSLLPLNRYEPNLEECSPRTSEKYPLPICQQVPLIPSLQACKFNFHFPFFANKLLFADKNVVLPPLAVYFQVIQKLIFCRSNLSSECVNTHDAHQPPGASRNFTVITWIFSVSKTQLHAEHNCSKPF